MSRMESTAPTSWKWTVSGGCWCSRPSTSASSRKRALARALTGCGRSLASITGRMSPTSRSGWGSVTRRRTWVARRAPFLTCPTSASQPPRGTAGEGGAEVRLRPAGVDQGPQDHVPGRPGEALGVGPPGHPAAPPAGGRAPRSAREALGVGPPGHAPCGGPAGRVFLDRPRHAIDHPGGVPRPEAVVDVDHQQPGGAGGEHPQQGRHPAQGGAVADAGGDGDHGALHQAPDHAGEGPLHPGHGDHHRGVQQPLAVGQEAVDAGHADVPQALHGAPGQLRRDRRFLGHRDVRGAPGGDHHRPPARGAAGRGRRRRSVPPRGIPRLGGHRVRLRRRSGSQRVASTVCPFWARRWATVATCWGVLPLP